MLSLENGDAQFIDSIVDVTVFPDYWQRSENYYFCQFVGDVKFTNEFLFLAIRNRLYNRNQISQPTTFAQVNEAKDITRQQ